MRVTAKEVEVGHVVTMSEAEHRVCVIALKDFEKDIAGPGNERHYWHAVILRERLERS